MNSKGPRPINTEGEAEERDGDEEWRWRRTTMATKVARAKGPQSRGSEFDFCIKTNLGGKNENIVIKGREEVVRGVPLNEEDEIHGVDDVR